MSTTRWLTLLTVPCLLILSGCGREALNYNNAVAGITKDLESAGERYGKSMGAMKGDPAKLKASHSDFVREVEGIVSRGRALKAPDAKGAKELEQAFHAYLNKQEQMARNELGELTQAIGNNDGGRVQALVARIQETEQVDVNNLKRAQAAYAQANNFKLNN